MKVTQCNVNLGIWKKRDLYSECRVHSALVPVRDYILNFRSYYFMCTMCIFIHANEFCFTDYLLHELLPLILNTEFLYIIDKFI